MDFPDTRQIRRLMDFDDDLKKLFDEIYELSAQPETRVYGTGLWKSWHRLADAQYRPAMEFLISKLDDPKWDWRRVSVSLLGFHYKLAPETMEKIRYLLAHDPDSVVRDASASVLGQQGQFPEKALQNAMECDRDQVVRETAFAALLDLAKVPYKIRVEVVKKVREGKIPASLGQLRSLLQDEAMFDMLAQL